MGGGREEKGVGAGNFWGKIGERIRNDDTIVAGGRGYGWRSAVGMALFDGLCYPVLLVLMLLTLAG